MQKSPRKSWDPFKASLDSWEFKSSRGHRNLSRRWTSWGPNGLIRFLTALSVILLLLLPITDNRCLVCRKLYLCKLLGTHLAGMLLLLPSHWKVELFDLDSADKSFSILMRYEICWPFLEWGRYFLWFSFLTLSLCINILSLTLYRDAITPQEFQCRIWRKTF